MAKLIITETFEGTNEQIQAFKEKFSTAAKNAKQNYKSRFGIALAGTTIDVDLDPVETPLQKQLRAELAQLRPVLSRSAIARAERIIDSYAGSSLTAEELLHSLLHGDECCNDEDAEFEVAEDEDEDDCTGEVGYHVDEDGDVVLDDEDEDEYEEVIIFTIVL